MTDRDLMQNNSCFVRAIEVWLMAISDVMPGLDPGIHHPS
jgi:hypothetical protein